MRFHIVFLCLPFYISLSACEGFGSQITIDAQPQHSHRNSTELVAQISSLHETIRRKDSERELLKKEHRCKIATAFFTTIASLGVAAISAVYASKQCS